ncbi:MAG: FprA family A-type flavoprotein [Bacilli bacterium]|jgi:flavorubredoxin|nr:FprA family A-type flavoprotein [Bacilli bacterium]
MVKVNKIKDNIYQIRVIDKENKNFHGCIFPVIDGSSYAFYLIMDEQVTLVDTIDDIYYDEVLPEIDKLLNGRKIDNVIVNHVEPDHEGSFALVMKDNPQANVYTSKAGIKAMQEQFFKEYNYNVVGYGDSLNIGKYNLLFMETPLVHWPDNMWTYLQEEKILFSNDAFGQLLVDDVVYDEELDKDKLLKYSREYYANIVMPNNKNVKALLTKFANVNWDIELICPAHGIMLKGYIKDMLAQYQSFANNTIIDNKALVVYESIWGNTKLMAQSIVDELVSKGYEVKSYQLSKSRISEIMDEMMDTKLLVLGSSNHNNCILPPVADFLERVKATHFENRNGIVFGSYGWAKIPFNDLKERLAAAKFNILTEPIIVNYTPHQEEEKTIKDEIAQVI